MDVICTPRRSKRPLSLDKKITDRRKSLFGVCGVSPLSSPEHRDTEDESGPSVTCHRSIGSPSWSSDESPRRMRSPLLAESNTPLKRIATPVKSLQNDFTQMALERTPEANRNRVIVPCTPSSSQRSRVAGATSSRRSPRILGVRKLSPDRGIITPETFYGRKALQMFPCNGPHTDGKALYQRIRESVRIRLPMETFPKEKKRARSSSCSRKAKRIKKIPRYRLFEEDEPKKKPQKKSTTPKSASKAQNPKRITSEADLEHELAVLNDTSVTIKKDLKCRKSLGDKPSYNWHFFNSKTPPISKMKKILGEKSPSSVLTPPPTIRKRKLISSFELDHLPVEEEENDENSSSKANIFIPKERGIVEQICDDFSEDENEEDLTEKNVDQLLEKLNQDVAEVLGEEVVKEIDNETSTSDETKKFYPLFTERAFSSDSSNLRQAVSAPSALKRRKLDPKQLILDVGQRGLREIECSQCGLLYVQGDDTDEAFHNKHHLKATVLAMPNWKKARIVRMHMNGERIILIKSGDPKSWWDRARNVLEVVDTELGYPSEGYSPTQVYLYLKKKIVVGCLAARPLQKANRLLPCLGLEAELCSEEEYPVRVGVSRLWVASGHRRSGIARSLIDSLRRSYTFGEILKSEDIAFSSPTEDGKKFAISYFNREDFLIYTFAPSYES